MKRRNVLDKTVKRIIFLALCGLGAAQAQTLDLRRGISLEGWMDQPDFEAVGPAQLSQLAQIRKEGFDFVRVPIYASTLLRNLDPKQEPAASLERVLDAARKNNLKVVVVLTDTYDKRAELMAGGKFFDTYTVLIEKFSATLGRRDPRWVGLMPLDEPTNCDMPMQTWQGQENRYIAAARKSAPKLTILLSGSCYADLWGLLRFSPLNDKNVIYTFQFLDPIPFTQQGNPTNDLWKWFKNVPYPSTNAQMNAALNAILQPIASEDLKKSVRQEFEFYGVSEFNRQSIAKNIGLVGSWAKLHKVKVMLSAFTVHESAPAQARLDWLRDVRQVAESQGLIWATWTWTSPYGYGLSQNGKLPPEIKAALGLR